MCTVRFPSSARLGVGEGSAQPALPRQTPWMQTTLDRDPLPREQTGVKTLPSPNFVCER